MIDFNLYFEYIDGKLINKVSRSRNPKGTEAGYMAEDGYLRICLHGKYYYVHKIIWWMHNGQEYQGMIDHKDTVRSNNRIENLRPAEPLTNQYNKNRQKDGTSNYKGVWWDKKKSVWKASIRLPDKRLYLGQFDTELEAALAYDYKAKQIHGEFAKLNIVDND